MKQLKNIGAWLLSRPLLIAALVLFTGFTATTVFLGIANRSIRHENKDLKHRIEEVQAENRRLEQQVKDREEKINENTILADSLKANLQEYREQLIIIDESGTNIRNADLEYHIQLLSEFLSKADSMGR